jgi:hypothetical protein
MSNFEYYAVKDTQQVQYLYWILCSDVQDPNTQGRLVMLSREHGTLVDGGQEFTILEITRPSIGLWGVNKNGECNYGPRFIQVKTPIKPDQATRFRVRRNDLLTKVTEFKPCRSTE